MGILNGIQERNTIKMVQTQTLGKLQKPSVFCIVYKILCQSLRLDSNQRPLRPENNGTQDVRRWQIMYKSARKH